MLLASAFEEICPPCDAATGFLTAGLLFLMQVGQNNWNLPSRNNYFARNLAKPLAFFLNFPFNINELP
jgi:hypothetical protein